MIAVKELEPYRRIGAADVAVIETPAKAVPPGCMRRLADVVGSCTRCRLIPGQMIQRGHLASDRVEAGLSYDLPVECRGIFLPLSSGRAVGGRIKEGERVDLIVVPKGFPGVAGSAGGAVTAVKGLPVLAPVKEPSSGEFTGIIVLALPQQCELIARHLEEGSVYVSLVPRLTPAEERRWEVWPSR